MFFLQRRGILEDMPKALPRKMQENLCVQARPSTYFCKAKSFGIDRVNGNIGK